MESAHLSQLSTPDSNRSSWFRSYRMERLSSSQFFSLARSKSARINDCALAAPNIQGTSLTLRETQLEKGRSEPWDPKPISK